MTTKKQIFSLKALGSLFFIVLLALSVAISFVPQVKADNIGSYSATSTGISLSGVDNNQGTQLSLNGFDIFATDTALLFYSGNGTGLVKNYQNFIVLPSSTYVNYRTRITDFNSTAILVVSIAQESVVDGYGGSFGVFAGLVDTQSFTNVTWCSVYNVDSTGNLGYSAGYVAPFDDIVLAQVNGVFYALLSGVWGTGVGYEYAYQTTLISVSNTGLVSVDAFNNGNTGAGSAPYWRNYNATQFLGGESIWIQSATNINTMFILTKNIYANAFQILMVNCVTPSLSNIGYVTSGYGWGSYVDYVQFSYDNFGDYDALIAFPSSNYVFKVDLIRFTTSTAIVSNSITFTDTNAASAVIRTYCVPPNGVWGDGTLQGVSSTQPGIADIYQFVWIGLNYQLVDSNLVGSSGTSTVVLSYLSTVSPQLTGGGNLSPYDAIGGSVSGSFGTITWAPTDSNCIEYTNYLFNPFTLSNDIGLIVTPSGYGNILMTDYAGSQVCTQFSESTNPLTTLYLISEPYAWLAGSGEVLPSTTNSISLSQNQAYAITGKLVTLGVLSGSGTFSITSTGEHALGFGYPVINPITSGTMVNGQITFTFVLSQLMNVSPWYETYVINVTNTDTQKSYIFNLNLSWLFLDNNGNALPPTYSGKSTGQGGGTLSTPPPNNSPLAILGLSSTDTALIVYAVCILGMCYIFYLMKSNNVPWAVAIGLIIATIVCNFLNLLGIYVYPIDILTGLAIIGIIFLVGRTGKDTPT